MSEVLPREVTSLLRLDGLAVLVAAVVAYGVLGGNWWVFAVLLLTPDLSMLGALAGPRAGSWTYNIVHTYALPITLGGIAWSTGATFLVPYALIWVAHIGMDRAVGYGLKFPGSFQHTHLGVMGKARKEATLANSR